MKHLEHSHNEEYNKPLITVSIKSNNNDKFNIIQDRLRAKRQNKKNKEASRITK